MSKTLLCLILDRSGSMHGKEGDVIGGVNNFIDDQKKLPDPAVIQLVRFDDQYEVFREAHDLAEAKHIDGSDYQPRGNTALLDAIGRTLASLEEVWKKHQPDRAIVVVATDGQENASHEFNKDQIKAMIQSREASGKWAFVYFGADVNAFHEAASMGFVASNTAHYSNTKVGTQSAYSTMSSSVGNMRATGTNTAGLGGHIDDDDDQTQQPAPAPVVVQPPQPAAATPPPTWTPPSSTPNIWTPPA